MDWYGQPPEALTPGAQALAAGAAVAQASSQAEAEALQAELAPLVSDAMEAAAHPVKDCPHIGVMAQRRRLFFGLVCGPLAMWASSRVPEDEEGLRAGGILAGLSITVYHLYSWWQTRQDVTISRYGAAYTSAPGYDPDALSGAPALSGPLGAMPTIPGQ